jgi:hypothetical protein
MIRHLFIMKAVADREWATGYEDPGVFVPDIIIPLAQHEPQS